MRSRLEAELPFLVTEDILMAAVTAGGDRQALHERIRVHSHAAAEQIKLKGEANDLIARLRADRAFDAVDFDDVLDPAEYVGLAAEQVDRFLRTVVAPLKRRYQRVPRRTPEIDV
jgi:adenylosuccinate lyase